ncbi:MAG: type II toxin-antitoxin system mRNA interferase toxin, RelE/StbE family [Candidatus Nanoarchaeia archaeon]|nr:type II toxin-antitoxin system mRNA interferase toxin, RelE/StbE family [Candidatus Nanoarchaeia archaeon]MDD5741502.1 type II toxin-antitoxin system mRNA interferase toxin, RelE/StbE family [Candidatus Nanoarchaeia archaeon]
MTYTLEVSGKLDRVFAKLAKKDRLQFEILSRKIKEILENPQIGEPLTGNMAGQRSVHIRNFVLVYEIIEHQKVIKLLDYDHHDVVYY